MECTSTCAELKELRNEFDDYVKENDKRVHSIDITLTSINTKVTWLVGILGAIGAAVLTAVIKMITG